MAGIRVFQEHGLPLSLSCVVLRSDLHGLPFTYQIADTLDAGKLKLIMPLRKGNALDLDEHEFIFGFEVLTSDETDQPTALAERLDDLLVACRRKAKILVGHDLSPDLARLRTFAAERRLPGVDTVRQQWADRATKGRGTAKMFDTAHDLGVPAAAELVTACEHAALKAATVADPDCTTRGETARQAITRTLAIALVAARATGKYNWTAPIDLDQLVADAAWDHLAQLGDDPLEAGTP